MLGAVAPAANDDPRQSIFQLETDQVPLVGDGLENRAAGPVRNDLAPSRRVRASRK